MKTIFTLLCAACLFLQAKQAVSQNCNYSSGGNGVSTATPAAITVDGNMADWTTFLNDPDNNSYDNIGGIDLDAPISDAGRDLTRFTFTENASHLFIYLARVGSVNNSVDIIFYADINNNDTMESREPVIKINWQGSNGNGFVDIYEYTPSAIASENVITANGDGKNLWGTLQWRYGLGTFGKGSVDGKSIEAAIPFAAITRLNLSGNVIDQLAFGENFKFHVSTINGQVSSIPNQNSINDNFGGCLIAPLFVLPVRLLNFDAKYSKPNVTLTWSTAQEINFSHFEIEHSTDGINYRQTAVVFGSGESGSRKEYSYVDNNMTGRGGLVYYRLKSVDNDGKVSYSSVRIIRIGESSQEIKLTTYPNPAASELRITIPDSWQNKKVMYELFGSNGQVAKKTETSGSSQTETIDVSKLSRGMYIVKATCGTESAQERIVKQ